MYDLCGAGRASQPAARLCETLISEQGGSPFTTFVVVTRAREAGRRDAARPARAAWAVQRLLAARW
jgi:hypothetical protein